MWVFELVHKFRFKPFGDVRSSIINTMAQDLAAIRITCLLTWYTVLQIKEDSVVQFDMGCAIIFLFNFYLRAQHTNAMIRWPLLLATTMPFNCALFICASSETFKLQIYLDLFALKVFLAFAYNRLPPCLRHTKTQINTKKWLYS